MPSYLILSRFSADAFKDPRELPRLADQVSRAIKERCPNVRWVNSYTSLGRFDVVDIVESDDFDQVEKAALIIRGLGHCTTETLTLTPWKEAIEKMGK